MEYIITLIAKFVIIACGLMYAYDCLSVFRAKSGLEKRWKFGKELFFTFLMHLAGYTVIYMHETELSVIILYAAELIFFILYLSFQWAIYPQSDKQLMNHVVFFLALGFVVLGRLNMDRAVKQFIIACGSAVISMLIPPFISRLKAARMVAKISGIVGLLLLMVVLVAGTVTGGAKLSVDIGDISLQPSEFVKLSFVLLIAMLFRKRNDIKRVIFATGIAALHVLVLVASKDLGSALIFFMAYLAMLYVATEKVWYSLAGLAAGAVASVGAYYLFGHVRTRVLVWLDPWSRISGGGYQVAQSLFAIGSGGWFGSGLYGGRPADVPVVQKDFIFSAIAEECGIIFAMALILACLGCLLKMIQVASEHQLVFYKLIGTGLATLYGVQVILTIGGAMKMIPSTGVTLPFVSYGGSSVLSTFLIFGVLQGIHIMKQKEVEEFEQERREELRQEARQKQRTAKGRAEAGVGGGKKAPQTKGGAAQR